MMCDVIYDMMCGVIYDLIYDVTCDQSVGAAYLESDSFYHLRTHDGFAERPRQLRGSVRASEGL